MSGRISDGDIVCPRVLAELTEHFQMVREPEVVSALIELAQSRALVTELRALSERVHEYGFLSNAAIRALLSAHAPQSEIQAVAAQATRQGIIGIDFDAQQAEGK